MVRGRNLAKSWARFVGAVGLALGLLANTACNEVRYSPMEDPAIPSAPPAPVLQVPEGAVPAPDPDLVADPNAPLPGSQLAYGEPLGHAEDYKEKADQYWDLNWLKKTTTLGSRTEDLQLILDDLRKRVPKTVPDANQATVIECIALYQKVQDAVNAQDVMRLVRIDEDRLPWGGGNAAIERELREEWLRTGEAMQGAELPLHLKRTMSKLQDFARVHREAPTVVERRAIAEAATKIDALGYELGLLGKDKPEERTHVEKVKAP